MLRSVADAIKKLRYLSDIQTARLVYFSCLLSLRSRGILLWGHAADVHRIFVLRKRAIRVTHKASFVPLRTSVVALRVCTYCDYFVFRPQPPLDFGRGSVSNPDPDTGPGPVAAHEITSFIVK
ncbi:hypothetical protein EVAR_21024_1 [Eumeta japonica]|uniref:Uncharacterized protein n=1 Tax=Eumeta variegata TaxID=151549 RepID=A0A4C1UZU0_EUMVA|nr:hypothetical protein EVAR_21024_1 [Eumeta japonica]